MLKAFYVTKGNGDYSQRTSNKSEVIVNSVTGSEPVTVSEAKSWGLIDTDADDTIIGFMITSVREQLESWLNRDIVAKERQYFIEYLGKPELSLPFAPINAVSSVTAGDDDTAQVLDSDYYIRGLQDKYLQFTSYPKSYVKVTYTTLSITDQRIKDAIKSTVEYIYDSRGLVSMDNFKGFTIPETAKSLLIGKRRLFV